MPERPERLVKYMSATTGSAVLERGSLRWTTPATLNDPYDLQFALRHDIDFDAAENQALELLLAAIDSDGDPPAANPLGYLIRQGRTWLRKMPRKELVAGLQLSIGEGVTALRENWPAFQKQLTEAVSRSKILCFSETATNLLMWAHYADSHRGLVAIFGDAEGVDSPYKLAVPVCYVPALPIAMDTEHVARIIAGQVETNHRVLMDQLLFTKGNDWAYEREWRLWSGDGTSAAAAFEDVAFHPEELKAVVFGARSTPDDRAYWVKLARQSYPSAELHQARLVTQSFQVAIDRIA